MYSSSVEEYSFATLYPAHLYQSFAKQCSNVLSWKGVSNRGYDSAGVATLFDGEINEVKSEGRVDNLEQNFDLKSLKGNIGIGHVRWATHGVPNSINAHPHSSDNVSVVHNGIIENSTILKKHLINKGHAFKSQTDTEGWKKENFENI